MKKAEHGIASNSEVSEHVEMAGWGVEEASEQHKSHASKYPNAGNNGSTLVKYNVLTDSYRPGNTTGIGICHSQVFHIRPSPSHGSSDSQDCQDAARMGMGYWKANDQGSEGSKASHHPNLKSDE